MNAPIRMIVTDLDGTLLRDDKTVSDITLRTLQACREKGVKVVFATARGISTDWLVPAELFDGRITENGAVAIVNGSVVYSRLIPYDIARPLLLACDRRGLKISLECNDMHYANFALSDFWTHITYFKVVDFMESQPDAKKLSIIIEKTDDIEFIEAKLPPELYMTVSNDGLGMVMHREATKSKAATALASHWGIDMKEAAAFGDDLNDIDMLEACGVGIAMENAVDGVKAVADFITVSNNDNGVALWLAEHLGL